MSNPGLIADEMPAILTKAHSSRPIVNIEEREFEGICKGHRRVARSGGTFDKWR